MSSRRRRRHARSPAVTPLDDDDLLSEILLRLPPQPSSLPRAFAVCKRWRRLVSDPGFFRRFRLHHRHNLPLLGFFDKFQRLPFVPTLEAPNRIPPGRFSLHHDDADRFMSLACRHGLFLLRLPEPLHVLVWDPVTGDQHRIAVPEAFQTKNALRNGTVLRPAGDAQHFQVILAVAGGDDEQHAQALACVYSSKTGLWGNLISTPISYQASVSGITTMVFTDSTLIVEDSLYWLLAGKLFGILEFDLVKQSLAVIRMPVEMCGKRKCYKIMRAEDGGLGFFLVPGSDCTAQLWKINTDCDGVASWELARTIELDKLLSLKTEDNWSLFVLGFAEENNVLFLRTITGFYLIHLESLKFKKILETNILSYYHPFESVYTGDAKLSNGSVSAYVQ